MSERIDALPWGWKLNLGLFAAAMEALSAIALLATSAYLISRASEQPPILYLMMAVVGVRAFALGRAAFRYLQRLMLHDAVFTHLASLRPALFEKLVALAPTGFSGSRGERLNRLTADVDELQNLGIRIIGPALQAAVALLVAFLILIGFFPATAVVGFLLGLLSLFVILLLTRLSAQSSEQKRVELRAQLRSELVEYLENVDLLTNLGWQERYRNRISQLGSEIQRAERTAALTSGVATSLTGLLAILVVSAGAIFAPAALANGTASNLLAIAVLLPLAAFDIFSGFQLAASAWQKYRTSKARVDALYGAEPGAELQLTDGPEELVDARFLELRDASLQLGDNIVHQNINIRFEPGRLTGLVGESGSGKTTVALALASLIRPVAGEYLIDGQTADSFTLASRRARVLLIEQDPHIFAGSIRQNLEISGVSDPKMLQQTLERVGLWSEFEARGGLDAEISESAGNISGGQAQRLAIARGLLAQSKFFVLDEPTSGLDWENSLRLIGILRDLAAAGHGIVVITHDLELAKSFDQVIRLG